MVRGLYYLFVRYERFLVIARASNRAFLMPLNLFNCEKEARKVRFGNNFNRLLS